MRRSLGVSAEEFFEALESLQGKEDSIGMMFGEILGAIAGFDVFMQMMREAAEELRSGRSGSDSSDEEAGGAVGIAPAEHK
jgi:hypothetical protein